MDVKGREGDFNCGRMTTLRDSEEMGINKNGDIKNIGKYYFIRLFKIKY